MLLSKSKRVLVVIPYLAKEAQGKELWYSVAGWRKHFKHKYLIVVVGDWHPVVDTGNDIVFIDCPRIPDVKGEYRAHLDHVHKFRTVLKHYPREKGFIYTCDDIYAVNDFTLEDVQVPKIRQKDILIYPQELNKWRLNNQKTRRVLDREGLPCCNYVCHLPVYYEKDKLLKIYDKYDCDNNSYVVEQLYFNTYNKEEPVMVTNSMSKYKFSVQRYHTPAKDIRNAFEHRIWINNAVEGWSPFLDKMLSEHYGI